MCNDEGLCGFVSENSSEYVFRSIANIKSEPITKVQLDQLFSLQGIRSISDDFFKYYWLSKPTVHFYEIEDIVIPNSHTINSIEQLKWGLKRIFIDTIYAFGNIQLGFNRISRMTSDELNNLYTKFVINTDQISNRGNTLHFNDIAKEDRYLISEMACKTFANIESPDGLEKKLIASFKEAKKRGVNKPTFRKLLDGDYLPDNKADQISMFAAIDILDEIAESEEVIKAKAKSLAERFISAHDRALKNTDLYLSLVNDLDVYVATSMRTKENFIDMANFCEHVFKSPELKNYDLRYFDPTMSASDSHEDKGLIECLMVKSAKLLIYSWGDRDSYGKDVEAAMALCLGKSTIFFCTKESGRAAFFRDVHPLSRLVNFKTGVASGVIVCEKESEVIEIVNRLINNRMRYEIAKKSPNRSYYLLKEQMTGSIVRIQTDNKLLTSVFWNNYDKN